MNWKSFRSIRCGLGLLACVLAEVTFADDDRLLATGGAMQIEGSAGGGLSNWALIAGLSDEQSQGMTLGGSYLHTQDFSLSVLGASYSWRNRFELSLARQSLSLDSLRQAIDLHDPHLTQDILGAKWRIAGDLIYDALPEFVLGFQYKQQRDFELAHSFGARSDHGIDIYFGLSRLWLDGPFHRNLLLSGDLRATRANQFGLLGFGGDRNNAYSVQAEGAIALFLNPASLGGAEYRQKPNNCRALTEDNACDVFLGWYPSKYISLVLAYTEFGKIAGYDQQHGYYISLNGTF